MFAIGGQATVYSTHDLTREGVTGTLPAFEPWLLVPTGATQSIDVQGGTSSIGELERKVVDHGGAVRALVGTTTLEGSSATLLVGYPGIAYSEFVVLHTYTLYKVIPAKSYTSFLFRSRDVQIDAKRTIWDHPVNGGALSDANPWILQGTPAEIIQAVWLFALGMPVASIDRAQLASLDATAEGLFCSARPFLFRLAKPFQAKSFIENQVLKAAGMYPVVSNTGQYSVRPFRAPASGVAPVFAFTADNCTALPDYDRAEILNDLLWSINMDGSGKYGRKLLFLDATSIGTFGRANERQVQSDGLRTELGAEWWCQEVSARMFARFSGSTALRGGAPLFSIEAFFGTIPVWVGDYVTLSHPKMPNLFTGALGVTDRVCEVIDRSPDYANGRMKFELLDTGLTGQPAAAQFDSAVIGTAVYY